MKGQEQGTAKPFEYSIFWTWDHSTHWDMMQRGMQEWGCDNPYLKRPEAFLSDYKMLVDFASEHRIGGIIIWGFIRDSHGGVEYSQELCRYARAKGVRILPGVGTSDYGGFYYEGNHKFSTRTWIETHPDMRAIGPNGQVEQRPCPSRPEYQEWLREGAAWLYDTFEVGGINLEHGDFTACCCDHCKKARKAFPGDDPDYYKDMAISEKPVMEVAHEKDPESWITYATYTGFNPATVTDVSWGSIEVTGPSSWPPRFPEYLPEYAICQWTLTDMWGEGRWPEGLTPPTCHSVGFFHQGSQCWPASRPLPERTRHSLILEIIRDMCAKAAGSKLEGVAMQGEVSAILPHAELNYLAFEYFSQHPGASLEELFRGPLGPKFGGEELSLKALEFLRLSGPRDDAEWAARRGKNITETRRIIYELYDDLDIRAYWGFVLDFLIMNKEIL